MSNPFRVLAAACLAAFCSAQQPLTFKIAGQVVRHADNRPIRRARVSIVMVDHSDRTLTAVSGENGEFQFLGLPAAKYQLRVQDRGSAQMYQETDGYSTAIVVGNGLDTEHILFPLDSAAGISGVVMDGDGDAVSGATVYLFGRTVSRGLNQTELKGQTNTTLAGAFHFGHLAAGTYYVAASGRPWYAQNQNLAQPPAESRSELDVAFPLTYYAGSANPEAAAPVTLEEGAKTELQITLNAVPALHIAWDGVEKQPEQNIQASLTQLGPGGMPITVMTMMMGPDGLIGVAPGNYILSANLYGPDQQTEIGSQAVSVAGDATVHLNEGVKTSVSGKVFFDGELPEGLGVWLGNIANGSNSLAAIAKDGSFNMAQLEPGRYSLLMANTNEFYIQRLTVKGAAYADGILDVAKGSQIELAITAGKGMTKIDGTVVNGKTPVAGAMVLLIPQDSTRAKYIPRDQSDSDGTFTLYQVPPGRYTLIAIQNGRNLAYAEPGIIAPYLPHGQVIDAPLPKDGKVEIEVQARR